MTGEGVNVIIHKPGCDDENDDGSDIGLEKERCSGSFHLAVRFLVIKDDSISCGR